MKKLSILLLIVFLFACAPPPTEPALIPTAIPTAAPTAKPVEILPSPTATALPPTPVPVIPFVSDPAPVLAFSNQTDATGTSLLHATPLDPQKDGGRMMGGGAVGDFNNDGNMDLFVLGGGARPDALFMNNGDGTFTDRAMEAGLGEMHLGFGATVGDYNADGWIDIYITSFGMPDMVGPGMLRLFRNNGDMTFTESAAEAGLNTSSAELADGFGAAFGDYDLDGDLDLFVAGWRKESKGNRLFQNDGTGHFTDVTDAAGIVDNGIRGFAPCFADMDGDHFPDLLVVADFGTSEYFVNNTDGTFTLFTDQANVGQEWSGMGTAIGDINNDGMIDWYVSAIFDDDFTGRGDGNKMYINKGNHTFEEVAIGMGTADGGWGWGSLIVDLNLDGFNDIVETNGWSDLPAYRDEMSKVFIQNPDGTFNEVAAAVGFDHARDGRGLINFDYDNDGDLDFVVISPVDEMELYRNDLTTENNWLRVVLDTSNTTGLAPNGFGSLVQATVGDRTLTHYVTGCSNYLTQSDFNAHFGLGTMSQVDELLIRWPDGRNTLLTNVAANQTIVVTP